MRRKPLTRFLIEQQHQNHIPAELRLLIKLVTRACKTINHYISKGALGDELGSLDIKNEQGEVQKKLGVLANEIFLEANEWGGHLAALASDEMVAIHPVPNWYREGEYLLLVDPIDGLSNVDVNLSVGTIFSVLKASDEVAGREVCVADFLQPGRSQVAAGYEIYGPQTMLVPSVGTGVYGFTLDREIGSFMLTYEDMQVTPETDEYAINASYSRYWSGPNRQYVEHCLAGDQGPFGRNYNMRWTASMVADIHRILIRGGVFLYPGDDRTGLQDGKIRLLYEASPMAYLNEQAGGKAFGSTGPILDIRPTAPHQRTAIILGCEREVQLIWDNYFQTRDSHGY